MLGTPGIAVTIGVTRGCFYVPLSVWPVYRQCVIRPPVHFGNMKMLRCSMRALPLASAPLCQCDSPFLQYCIYKWVLSHGSSRFAVSYRRKCGSPAHGSPCTSWFAERIAGPRLITFAVSDRQSLGRTSGDPDRPCYPRSGSPPAVTLATLKLSRSVRDPVRGSAVWNYSTFAVISISKRRMLATASRTVLDC